MSAQVRLQFALQHLQPSHWAVFEQLASTFAAADFPALRVLAGVGDEGRDAILQDVSNDSVIIQYSIAEDWKRKVRDTVRRLDETKHKCAVLVYFTNRQIGIGGDRLKADMLQRGISLDIRDRSYFVARAYNSRGQQQAAEQFANSVVDPLLPVEDALRNSPIANPHLRAGLLYLELQARDMESGRNIARLSYDALVLAALRDTDPQRRLTRDEVLDAVTSALPGREQAELGIGVNGALLRLRNKKHLNFTGKDQTYNLHFEQRRLRDERALDLLAERENIHAQLIDLARSVSHELEIPLDERNLDTFANALESLFEVVLERQGNQFAEAIRAQTGSSLRQDVRGITSDFVSGKSLVTSFAVGRDALIDLLVEAMAAALLMGGAVRKHLRHLADAYTLLAFMRETTDVQEAVSHFFSRGKLVFDTTAVLPCFGEMLLPQDDERNYTNLIKNAQAAGMELYVTPDVCNEIYSHFTRAVTCARLGEAWEGPIPLVYADWLQHGGSGSFASFADQYGAKGEDEVQFFLETALGFRVVELEGEAMRITDTARFAVQELWRPRKKISQGASEMERDILLRHDMHMYFGVLGLRKGEKRDYYGYEAWWVTEDQTAVRMYRRAKSEGIDLPSDPCMNPTFLSTMLAIGPRQTISLPLRDQLPLALAMQRFGYGVENLTALANEIRAEFAHEPEWFIRRKIWERMNEFKHGKTPEADDELVGGTSDQLLIESAGEGASSTR